jgi:hypothetical protein
VFVFGQGAPPLLALKLPRGDGEAALRLEEGALREAAPAEVAPRALGLIGPWYAQEALPGAPLRVEPLTVDSVPALGWPASLESLAAGIARLGAVTCKPEPPTDVAPLIEAAKGERSLTPATRRAIGAAWRDVRGLTTSVLRHRDTSAQNCLFQGDRLIGLVDWEMSTTRGSPGFDVWNAALAWVEHGLGLRSWSEERAVAALAASWKASPFWTDARAAARVAAAAGGAPELHLDALEVLFFAVRVGVRVVRPDTLRATGLAASAAMLEVVRAD